MRLERRGLYPISLGGTLAFSEQLMEWARSGPQRSVGCNRKGGKVRHPQVGRQRNWQEEFRGFQAGSSGGSLGLAGHGFFGQRRRQIGRIIEWRASHELVNTELAS